uniref:Glycosyltransferase 2-like domain-containing protein n=1 Tax=Alexandrium catenella TaxID=2925 RepID=A0A7S1MNA6_ALECA|mmetsp:Transcript_30433/g.82404  ORF Transcript_30433/g.82404 Transcript_30433/m.82404 type:complete len:588 (+) Transcript_30433:2-1765(+)
MGLFDYIDGTGAPHAPPLTPLWAAYFSVLLIGFGLQSVSCGALVAAAVQAWQRWWRRRRCAAEQTVAPIVEEPVAAIVPCYLPNEASIVRETVEHLLHRMMSVERLDVHLVYNTPHELPVEAELRELAEGVMPKGRRLFVERVFGSTSKAENLNHAIQQISSKYVAIYDADHRPDPDSLALAVSHLEATGVDCVQGSTYIRAGCCLAQGLTQAEFFVTYFVMLPLTEALTGTGFFGGSNGIWKASSLAEMRFDEQALTEDIDCFLRASLDHGLTFSFLPESCSGELLPSSLTALWRQRLRWTMGWDQATMRHASRFWNAHLPLRSRIGLHWIFVCRWLTLSVAVFVCIFNTMSSLRHVKAHIFEEHAPELHEPHCIVCVQHCSAGLYAALVAYALLRAVLHKPGWKLPCSVLLYFTALPVYIIFATLLCSVSLLRLASGNTGKWVVTSRHEEPLLKTLPESPSTEALLQRLRPGFPRVLLTFAFITVGALVGAIISYPMAQRTERRPMQVFGWEVPFGIGATNTIYTDGRVVVEGMTVGLVASLALLLAVGLAATCCARRLRGKRCAGAWAVRGRAAAAQQCTVFVR